MSNTGDIWGTNPGSGDSVFPPVPSPGASGYSAEPISLPVLPLLVMIGVVGVSLTLILLPFDQTIVALVGYLLTPFASIGCLAWISALDSNLKLNVWYDRRVGKLLAARILAGASFAVGLIHMREIALFIARIAAGGLS